MKGTWWSARRTLHVTSVSLLTAVFASSAAAQYEVTWYTVDAGGTMDASGGGYTAGGTIGQPDAGMMGGGGYAVTGGFWVFGPAGAAANQPGLPSTPQHQAKKNRYLSLDLSTNSTTTVAYQVTLASMKRCTGDERRACAADADCPGVCTGNNDLQCADDSICGPDGPCLPTSPCIEHGSVDSVARFVDEPYSNTCVPLDDCVTQWFAQLSTTPVYRVWTEDTVHITDCTIVPVAMYDVQATSDAVVFSNPLTIGTIDKPHVHYADCVGPVVSGQYTSPDGFTNVTDVQAYLIANQGGATAPHTTWVDLHGAVVGSACTGGDCIVPQQVLNVGDLQTIKFGYLGQTYVETPGQDNPGDCP